MGAKRVVRYFNNFVFMNLTKLKQLHSIEDDEIEEAEEVVDTPSRTKPVVKEVVDGKATLEVALEDGDEIINGKLYKSYMFKPGNSAYTKRQEGPRDTTIQKIMWGIKDRRAFKHFMGTAAMDKAIDCLMELEGKDYLSAYIALVPYALPKIATIEYKSDEPISIDEHQKKKQSVVIIRNMSTGLERRINTD